MSVKLSRILGAGDGMPAEKTGKRLDMGPRGTAGGLRPVWAFFTL